MMLETLLLMLPALPGRDFKPDDVRDVIVEIAAVTDDVQEAATLLVTAYAESRFRPGVVGDHGRAFGAYQLQGVPAWVGFDLHLATPIAQERLRKARQACPSSPLAPYIGSCGSPAARRSSTYRMQFVDEMTRRVSDIN
jgi:hypothetical protein